MRRIFLIACLFLSLCANTAFSVSKYEWMRPALIPIGISMSLLGLVGTVMAFIPSYGGAASYKDVCGNESTVCIDSCTGGCLNMRELQCVEKCPLGEKYRWCMLSINSYHFANDTSECIENGCRGGAQCASGETILPWTLDYPDKVYAGSKWGIPVAIMGVLSAFGGIVVAIHGYIGLVTA